MLPIASGAPTGTGVYAWTIVDALARRGNLDLVLFCRPDIDRTLVPPGAATVTIRWPQLGNMFSRALFEQTLLPLLLRRHHVDVLFCPTPISSLWKSVPTVVTVHDMYAWRIPETIKRTNRPYLRLMVPASVRRSTTVIAVSRNTAEDVEEIVGRCAHKMRVVHEASAFAVTDERDPEPPRPTPFVLFVANITRNKNVDTLVNAAVRLSTKGIECPFYAIGHDSYRLLAKAIAKHDASALVFHVGRVDTGVLRRFYQHALCIVHPSVYEGFGLPALEAQALGCPLVCSRGGALPEVAGDGALYFDHASPVELANAIEALYRDPNARHALVRRGRENLERFSWERAAEETEQILQEAAVRSRRLV